MAGAGQARCGDGTAAERKHTMRAQVGDLLVADGAEIHRVCEIIRLNHADGSPPYVVRWLSDGHIALLFPGHMRGLSRMLVGKQITTGPDSKQRTTA